MPSFTHHPDGRPFNPADYPDIYAVDDDGRVVPEAWIEEARAASANRRVADTLALLDHGAPDAVLPSVRRIAALLCCSIEAASYIDALETRVAALEGKVSELRYDVRKVRRAA